MKTEFTIILNELFKTSDKGYKDVENDLGYSERTFRRWLGGDTEPTISVFYKVVEYLGGNKKEVQARIGMAALDEWEKSGFKNAKELMEEHAAEKARIHANYEEKINVLVMQSDKRQEAFNIALTQIGEQYRKNADYLTGTIRDNEAYIRDLLAKTEHSNAIAIAAQKRAEEAEKRADSLDKRRYHVFWSMMVLVLMLAGVIVASMLLNLPSMGWGNY